MPGFPSRHKPLRQIAPVHVAQAQPENYGQGRGGRPWRRKRDAIMKRDKYLCVPCGAAGRLAPAEEVDHVIPQAEGGTGADDNLQAICVECHIAKTKAEAARGANRSHPRRGRQAEPPQPRGGGSKL
ncbi:HNH endonuclease [Xanthomonas campestris]|uniref:HNH endonuclease n=1 Tax=Xanthomonas campestris TaxID=339 RepID=UPI0023679EC1|nr:HNH endonuclease [Xanthomonas campestris]WDJ03392.1 HNH endonuclease [Xanthomonas campestris]